MKSKALAIYIHIPFCVKKCLYCDFLSVPATEKTQEAYGKAICQEIRNYKKSLLTKNLGVPEEKEESIVTSVFFGGGTPSLICGEEIAAILNELRHKFHFSEDMEITIECNPGTVDEEKLNCYRKAGINRLSFGLQSANNEDLKKLGRIHSWEDFLESFSLARKLGFSNINIDLMSALPGQTEESYEQTLQKVLLLEPEHISAYSLIIEEGTPFYEKYSSGFGLPDEDSERMMYQRTKERLEQSGYYRYEISNYAKPGYECRHNLCYWDGTNYIGFGLGASSMVDHIRYHNCSDLQKYMMQASKPEQLWEEVTVLSLKEQMEEFMFLGLRCIKGISINKFKETFGISYDSIYGTVTKKMKEFHLIDFEEDRIYLTEKGIDISNYVLSEFLIE
ncbi:Oxygen-independent coproporphyrinogen-III oxidase 1 [Clostridiales bacterium CHKCI001]|nr:Oxygen-independent coproporphyrinogen-III oxidase 1 [Clostridiales bacterium CHKCI001]